MNEQQKYHIRHEAEEEARHVSGGAAWIVIGASIVVIVSLGLIVFYTVKEGTFCAFSSVALCWLALVAAVRR